MVSSSAEKEHNEWEVVERVNAADGDRTKDFYDDVPLWEENSSSMT